MFYPAHFEPADEGGFVVTFRDIPEAITQGDTLEEATAAAQDALVTAMDFYFEDGRPIPPASAPQEGERVIDLPPSVYAKILVLNAFLDRKMTRAELARSMGEHPQHVGRIFDLHHSTKIDTIARALSALGLRLVISAE